ncbi:hypothetical protein [Pasteurella sp. PK-2025]|uniref:hypothetical protein n=1 Tax=Pasteurella sp. PK-2025 TaxID=3413133 RepID=UPI003C750888
MKMVFTTHYPEEFDFIFEYIDILLEPTIAWGVTALGGRKSINNLKVVDYKAYIHLIGQAVGKFIDLSD